MFILLTLWNRNDNSLFPGHNCFTTAACGPTLLYGTQIVTHWHCRCGGFVSHCSGRFYWRNGSSFHSWHSGWFDTDSGIRYGRGVAFIVLCGSRRVGRFRCELTISCSKGTKPISVWAVPIHWPLGPKMLTGEYSKLKYDVEKTIWEFLSNWGFLYTYICWK